jgi:hypothetical protein
VCEGFTLEHVDVGEVTLRGRHGDDGQPVVLLHGPRTHATSHRIAPQLAGSFFIACPDLRANDLRTTGRYLCRSTTSGTTTSTVSWRKSTLPQRVRGMNRG